jgi:glutamate racemase
MTDRRPIGVLDSGVGGLSVLREVRRTLPDESVIYVADHAHLPYGPRSQDEIRTFVVGIAHFLIERECKLLIIACNAANAAALHHLRGIFPDTPIIGMEPAIKPAASATRTGVIGVITTQATFQGELFASVIDRFANGIRVETQVCPQLVALAEAGAPDTPEARAIIARDLAPLKGAGIDQLVLGCTHFPFLAPLLAEYFGPGVNIVDPAPAVARQARRVLEGRDALSKPRAAGEDVPVRYVTTGDPGRFATALATLLDVHEAEVLAAQWEGNPLRLAAQ